MCRRFGSALALSRLCDPRRAPVIDEQQGPVRTDAKTFTKTLRSTFLNTSNFILECAVYVYILFSFQE